LREFGTGGLRRIIAEQPFSDVILSERTPRREKDIADHPGLKTQSFIRPLVRATLPLGKGIIADTFMGAGSTIAAAESLGLYSIGVERHPDYFEMSKRAIPKLASLPVENVLIQPSLFNL